MQNRINVLFLILLQELVIIRKKKIINFEINALTNQFTFLTFMKLWVLAHVVKAMQTRFRSKNEYIYLTYQSIPISI